MTIPDTIDNVLTKEEQENWDDIILLMNSFKYKKVHKIYSSREGWVNITSPNMVRYHITYRDSYDYVLSILNRCLNKIDKK